MLTGDDYYKFTKGWVAGQKMQLHTSIRGFAYAGDIIYALKDDDFILVHPLMMNSRGHTEHVSRLDFQFAPQT